MNLILRRWRPSRSIAIWAACLAGVMSVGAPASADQVEVWFSATEPVWRQFHNWPANDYMQLFEPSAPWQSAARGVKVFMLAKKFVAEASDADLQTILGDLQRRHIALAVQGTPLTFTNECGRGIESYGPPHDMLGMASRVRHLGGTIAYVAVDEPLFFGHQFDRKDSPHAVPRVDCRAC